MKRKCFALTLIFLCLVVPSAVWGQSESKSGDKKSSTDDPELKKLIEDANKEAGKEEDKKKDEGDSKDGKKDFFKDIAGKINALNPSITVFGDAVFIAPERRIKNEDGDEISNRFNLREVELDFRAAVDPYAKGVLVLALGQEEPNEFELEIEEGYAVFTFLPKGLGLQVGKYRLPIGLMNKLHLHDLPQTEYPLVVQNFFGEEGLGVQGATLSYLFPISFPIELTATIFNGEQELLFAGNDDARHPAYHTTLKFSNEAGSIDYEFGLNYLIGWTNKGASNHSHLVGSHFFIRWRPKKGGTTSFVLQGEAFYSEKKEGKASGRDDYNFGAYIMAQFQFLKDFYLGTRYDWSDSIEDEDKEEYRISGFLSYYTTEFLRFRMGYEYRNANELSKPNHVVYFQLTFIFGSHPAEPYWFNK